MMCALLDRDASPGKLSLVGCWGLFSAVDPPAMFAIAYRDPSRNEPRLREEKLLSPMMPCERAQVLGFTLNHVALNLLLKRPFLFLVCGLCMCRI